MHTVTSLLYFSMIYTSQYKYTSVPGKITHLQAILQKRIQNSKFAITDMREKSVDFFYFMTQASILAPAMILLSLVSLQKFPFL